MMASVPRATLVIANPTHYAIALRYVREVRTRADGSREGQRSHCSQIREIAEENLIPVVEDKALARSMYDSVEWTIRFPEFYRAVAELIHSYMLTISGERWGNESHFMLLRQKDSQALLRTKALAEGLKEVAAELRLVDLADFVTFIHREQFANIQDSSTRRLSSFSSMER